MTSLRVPDGPKGSWLGGNLPDFRKHRLDFLTRCARAHGDMVKLRFAHRTIYLVCHPDWIEEVLVTHSKHFTKHFALRLNPVILGNGLLTSEGDFWLRQRRLIQPVFSRSRILGYASAMVEAAQRLLATWRSGEQRDMHAEMMRVTLDVAAKTLFGAEVSGEAQAIAHALEVAQQNFLLRFNSILPLPMWIPTPANRRMNRAVRQLDDVIYRIIRQRRAEMTPGIRSTSSQGLGDDLLSLLLNARAEDDGSAMTDKQLRDEAMTLFLAGHETTALTLSWAWFLLAQHPEAEHKLWAELDAVLAGRTPSVDDWPKLKFTAIRVSSTSRRSFVRSAGAMSGSKRCRSSRTSRSGAVRGCASASSSP